MVLLFNLSTLPNDIADTNVIKAELALYCITGEINGTNDVQDTGVARVLSKSWKGGEVTWANADAGNAWTNKGGDFGEDDIFKAPFVEANNWENYDVTEPVKSFLTGREPNYGFIIATAIDINEITDFSSPDRQYIASDYAASSELRPKLSITYESAGISNFISSTVLNNKISVTITPQEVKFYVPFQGSYTVTLTDIKGRTITSFNGSGEKLHRIPATKLSNGMHILGITTEGKIAFTKFLFVK